MAHTFESLVELGHIDILYETIIEPNDPTNAVYDAKVLGFGRFTIDAPLGEGTANPSQTQDKGGGTIPWIDLGYRPKELGRLKVECKAVSEACGFSAGSRIVGGGFQDFTYSKFFGYEAPTDIAYLGDVYNKVSSPGEEDIGSMYSIQLVDRLKGHFTIGSYIPKASGWVYTAEGPQFIDG